MFKVGDKVRIKPEEYSIGRFTNYKFTIVGFINPSIAIIDKSLNNIDSKSIHIDYLELDVKEIRKQKIKKLNDYR
jgi:hypothetical protein